MNNTIEEMTVGPDIEASLEAKIKRLDGQIDKLVGDIVKSVNPYK